MKQITKSALTNAAATAVYVALVGSFFFYGQRVFPKGDTVLAPIAMLMLLVFSAAFCGTFIFGQPILWFMSGKKKEALSLLATTMGFFFLIMLAAFFGLLLGRA